METRANYALIGAFTLAVLGAAFMFVFWFSRASQEGSQEIRVMFTSSVSGLSRGSNVTFNGVRVGEVKSIELAPNNPSVVFATIEVSDTAPVKQDTRARLEYQGLTGVASIALSGGASASPPLRSERGLPVIEAVRSDYQNILETLQRLAGRTETALDSINALIAANADSIQRTVRNFEEFSSALEPEKVKSIIASADTLGKQLTASADRLDKLMASLDVVFGSGDITGVVSEVTDAARSFRKLADNLDARTKEMSAGLSRFTGAGLRQYEALAADGRRTLEEINRTLRSLERNPQQLLFGRKPATPEYSGR
jgi:phospholipid/cholesterol/gamma-HCH transport system substrate-binding protein